MRKDVDEYEAVVRELETEQAQLIRNANTFALLSENFGQRGVQTFILQNAVTMLESVSQSYLDQLSDGGQKLQLALDSGDRIARRAFVRAAEGEFRERSLASLSGGQWKRCSLALSLGFSDLVARRLHFQSSLCVMDEPLAQLDHSGRAAVGRVLRGLIRRTAEADMKDEKGLQVSTILVILQDLAAEELGESFDCIDEVVKRDGFSFVAAEE